MTLVCDRDPLKTIPSGFFRAPDNKGIAAVIFSNSHTSAKFSRIGYQMGYAPPGLRMIRWGSCFDADPRALAPLDFAYEVGTTAERWADGLVVMHNPNAMYPLDRRLFKGLTQMWERDGRLNVDMAEFHVYSSVTDTWLESPPAQ